MATQAGVILGTAAYMSPEQAKGFAADHRSDVFSFGVVLYEMLTGRQPFPGETAADVLASLLAREPDLTALPPNLNPRIAEVLRRCLDKGPRKRWQAVGDLRAEIEALVAVPWALPTTRHVIQPVWKRVIPATAAALLASVITGVLVWSARPRTTPMVVRLSFALAEDQQFRYVNRQAVAISPDGTKIAYVVDSGLYIRSMSETDARSIVLDDADSNLSNPVFSPDGRSIAFFSGTDRTLKKVAVSGGAAVTLCPADYPFGASWSEDGIVFGLASRGILRVSANGGEPEVLVAIKGTELAPALRYCQAGRRSSSPSLPEVARTAGTRRRSSRKRSSRASERFSFQVEATPATCQPVTSCTPSVDRCSR
jgi:serine/threonine protein kinase